MDLLEINSDKIKRKRIIAVFLYFLYYPGEKILQKEFLDYLHKNMPEELIENINTPLSFDQQIGRILKELEDIGFIYRQRKGQTNEITLIKEKISDFYFKDLKFENEELEILTELWLQFSNKRDFKDILNNYDYLSIFTYFQVINEFFLDCVYINGVDSYGPTFMVNVNKNYKEIESIPPKQMKMMDIWVKIFYLNPLIKDGRLVIEGILADYYRIKAIEEIINDMLNDLAHEDPMEESISLEEYIKWKFGINRYLPDPPSLRTTPSK